MMMGKTKNRKMGISHKDISMLSISDSKGHNRRKIYIIEYQEEKYKVIEIEAKNIHELAKIIHNKHREIENKITAIYTESEIMNAWKRGRKVGQLILKIKGW